MRTLRRLWWALLLAPTHVLLAATPALARMGPDPMRELAGDSPLCKEGIDASARANCRATGAIEHAYPLDRYKFDWHIDTGITHINENLMAAIQWAVSIVWIIQLYALKAVLLVFQWAFSLDLLGRAMGGLRAEMQHLHNTTLGRPWFVAAISIFAIWALWRALVQGQKAQTVAGVAMTVAMMILALVIINRPAETVGAASRGANAVGLGFLSGASQGTLKRPHRAVSRSSEDLFSTIVLRPWCAIQFGNVEWCLARAPGDRRSRADRWLRWDVGTPQRNTEYEVVHNAPDWKPPSFGGADTSKLYAQLANYHPTKADVPMVDMQGKSKTLFRVGLVALVVVGQVGCLLVIGYLAINVLLQAMLALLFCALAPVALFAPAFGEAGRAAFRKWGLSLLAAVISKATYALLIAVVLGVAELIAGLGGRLPWLVVWLLWAIYWWGLYKARHKIMQKLSFGGEQAHAKAAGSLYYRAKSAQMAALAGGAVVGATAGRLFTGARRTGASAADRLASRRAATSHAVRELSEDQLRERARQHLDHKYEQYHQQVARHDDAEKKIRSLDKGLQAYDRRVQKAVSEGKDPASVTPSAKEAKMAHQRRQLRARLLPRHEVGVARKFIETADRNEVEQGRRFSDKQIDVATAGLREDLRQGRGSDDAAHAWRAGIPRHEYDKLSPAERASLMRPFAHDVERDRRLLRAAGDGAPHIPSRRDRRDAARVLDHQAIRERRGEQLRQRKAERQQRSLERRELERVHRRPRRRRR